MGVLRGLNDNTVDLIYLDPPFNSNREYSAPTGREAEGASFNDKWSWGGVDQEYLALLEKNDPPQFSVINTARQVHSGGQAAYLVMMSERLVEMRRVLKDKGSIYLHCDQSASHYLKLLMDSIFGRKNFRNEIIWKRVSHHAGSKGYGRITDSILLYGAPFVNVDAIRTPLNPEHERNAYRHKDARGVFSTVDLVSHTQGRYRYNFHGRDGPWIRSERSMLELEADGRIYFPKTPGAYPRMRFYLHENKGMVVPNLWTDISNIAGRNEATGYPTQKPVELLERIIKASSNPGDVVLDPFCGSATTCEAAEKLGRQWVCIDISANAADVVRTRLKETLNREAPMFNDGIVIHRTDLPTRTDC